MPETGCTDRVTDRAPEAFGLTWAYSRAVRGDRRLFIAEGETGAFADAYRRCRDEMRTRGYSYAEPYVGDAFTGTRPCFWLSSQGWDPAALDAIPGLVRERIVESKARDAEIMARRAARDAQFTAALEEQRRRHEALVPDARRSMDERRWSWAKAADVEEAEALIARKTLGHAAHRRLRALLDRADANVARAEAASAVPVASELGLARIPAIRAAAAEGVALMTERDSDRASRRNDSGWSKSTSYVGHVLAARGEDLDEAQASNALRILRTHRRQLPPPLAARLFEGAGL
ncbi:hypothetical protein [Methylobacterium brachythecii]|uniref:Uncharacterized protein n=1 Tax=Methylobacterium brachythecii TaxID=1176177 RepID=A0A7W6AMJ4_9HYPH|nr:hypothetical protein [Methylobacterium brachythecii]MBB3905366.1 hypothetical protein [Methylobacterium brachythecii]GLS45903.1 hypothetical protein GCM10007884_38940 [Methylobacterium brachythecii]